MITHETGQRKFVSVNTEVYSGYAKKLGDNNCVGDDRMMLMLAPAIGGYDEVLYCETNGDPVFVGWLEDGEFEPSGNWRQICEQDDFAWAQHILAAEFLP